MLYDILTVYGSIVLALMMIFYLLEKRNIVYTLFFAITCFGSSLYGFLSGVYPFFVIELIWGAFALKRFIQNKYSSSGKNK
ncbi:MAG: hypothetical protein QXZ44_05785 [Ferroplasma sp.]